MASATGAQTSDSARSGVRRPSRAADAGPPISPRRAFLLSAALPGYGQIKLGRRRAAALFATAEVVTIGMAFKSAADLREARRRSRDSIPLTFFTDSLTGLPIIDPVTGKPKVKEFAPNRFTPERVRARKTHYEDWIAAILFNHVLSGADAYVAANLWDLPVNIGTAVSPRHATLTASILW